MRILPLPRWHTATELRSGALVELLRDCRQPSRNSAPRPGFSIPKHGSIRREHLQCCGVLVAQEWSGRHCDRGQRSLRHRLLIMRRNIASGRCQDQTAPHREQCSDAAHSRCSLRPLREQPTQSRSDLLIRHGMTAVQIRCRQPPRGQQPTIVVAIGLTWHSGAVPMVQCSCTTGTSLYEARPGQPLR